MSTFLWVIFPYICLAVFVVGHIWRYRYDKFGWTTRSSQLYESKLLRIGSPLFHFGILGVAGGHFLGLVIPQSLTDRIGMSHGMYHFIAMAFGIPAGIAAVVGLAILIYRRRTVGPVFSATTINDKAMYAVLAVVMFLGIWNTIAGGIFTIGGEYNYRDGVSPWFRQIFWFQPDTALMAGGVPRSGGAALDPAPLGFQLHALAAFLLIAMWPFTRLVHVFSAPIGYFTRPYIVYRSRDSRPGSATGSRAPKRGWEKVG
ncbi:respiratory nitrate reductase subunit gamma [Ornithinimicrobium ciconiae]|uniref:Nitrate reductase-like protein NarX n=1 Tax=Ornithinimicrobium ciconiae TaxID=2594265 RepID=A0A516GB06_9MICO|nr:respiratory nitrate reductase subunit gamma [Ornithinimicrobium ciconiae]QDO88713.1 respiratory nitrate reductase subunit gamma [Ornithinimicrobium ciconiae]